jgi:hypothetical protein
MGNRAEALPELEAAFEARPRSFNLIYLAVDPALDPLRGEGRFQQMLARVGLTGAPVMTSSAGSK